MPYAIPPLRHASALGALLLVLASAPAWAQATAEQQQACAPDALKLCSDTIPDIPKTTACMKAHVADLSPRCRTAFNEAIGGAPKATASKVAATKVAASRHPTEATKPRVAARSEREATLSTRREPGAAVLPPRAARLDRTPTGTLPAAVAPVGNPPAPNSSEPSLVNLCRAGLIDAYTCHNTIPALGLLR